MTPFRAVLEEHGTENGRFLPYRFPLRALRNEVTLSTYQWLRSRGIEQCGRLRARSTEQWERLRARGVQQFERVRSWRRDANGNEKPAQDGDCPTTVEDGGIPMTGRNRASAPLDKY
ncbi:hypothetical protein AAVH_36100 [Aphelenchoides avenae]|nr:hypothetical protein AAVH_36100 [Aphelenchus avenae]